MKQERNNTVDVIRGLAILMVVLGHTMSGCTQNSQASLLHNVIWTLQMPIFMLISGYVSRYSKPLLSVKDFGRYLVKKTISYLIPWTVWTFIIRGVIWRQTSYLDLKFVLYNMDSGYWFLFSLWTIVVIYGLSSFISEMLCKKRGRNIKLTAFTVSYILGMAILTGVGLFMGFSFLCIKLTLYYMPFYYIGYLYGRLEYDFLRMKHGKAVCDIAVAISFVLWTVLIKQYNFYTIGDDVYGIALRATASMLGCVAVCGLVSKFKPENSNYWDFGGWLRNIGTHSMEIYLMHYLFLSIVKAKDTPQFNSPEGIMLTACNFIITVGISYGISLLIDKNMFLKSLFFGRLK